MKNQELLENRPFAKNYIKKKKDFIKDWRIMFIVDAINVYIYNLIRR